ncbi:NtaA/DmoA family FMN-dependent monooxygenase [Kocuria massiliensis]|uniref:NtaA/DmoA family FMN-dependent monooxygenase n=1 Tax=Kocuria massiliensis TaxID=1926282 RepID=UPI0022B99CE0|nr:NtaA/DmoA family FMN-dependent monooxygenase [Kocuria massiliensis]
MSDVEADATALSSRPLRLGVMPTASGAPDDERAWMNPEEPVDASINPEWYRQIAGLAEEGTFDLLFVADAVFADPKGPPHYLSRFEPFTLLSYLAALTSKIGLVGTVSSTYQHPYNIARMMLSLDHLSRGRAGWNVVTSLSDQAARNFGLAGQIDHHTRYARAEEAIEVVRGLWHTHRPDSFPRDRSTGRYMDAATVRALDHRGEFFDVAGPLNIESSPQGEPVIFQAGQSPQGLRLAAATADAVFAMPTSITASIDYRSRLREAGSQTDANRPDPRLFARLIVLVTDDGAEDAALKAYWQRHGTWDRMAERVAAAIGRPVADGGPIRDEDIERAMAHEGTWLAEPLAAGASRGASVESLIDGLLAQTQLVVAGSAASIARTMLTWHRENAVDGFILQVSDVAQFRRFVEEVVPELRRLGAFRHEYPESATLRGLLGLAAPDGP